MKKRSPQKIPLLLVSLAAALLPGTGLAQTDTWYQVEMVVFEHLYPRYDGEYWFKNPGLSPLTDSVVLRNEAPVEETREKKEVLGLPLDAGTPRDPGSPGKPADTQKEGPAPLMPYLILPEKNHRLGDIYRMMRQSRDYRPHYHVSWLQPAVDGRAARAVHVQSRETGNLFELTMPPTLVTDPMPANFYEPVRLIVDGTVRIRSSTYLHVDMDMVLFRQPPFLAEPEPLLNDPAIILKNPERLTQDRMLDSAELTALLGDSAPLETKNPVDYVRLKESRRIRLNELHYFDHPMFGVILQVSRYEREEEE